MLAHIIPLRKRREDPQIISILAVHFVEQIYSRSNQLRPRLRQRDMVALERHATVSRGQQSAQWSAGPTDTCYRDRTYRVVGYFQFYACGGSALVVP